MKKTLFFFALVAILCGQASAQVMAVADNANSFDINTELSLANTVNHSLYSPLALNSNSVFGTNASMDLQAYQDGFPWRKILGIGLIISGSSDILGGLGFIAWSQLVKKMNDDFNNSNMSSFPTATKGDETDPIPSVDDEFNQGVNTMTNIALYAGIGITVIGAGMLTGGILLVKSDGNSSSASSKSSGGYANKNTRNTAESKKYKHKRRTAENLLAPESQDLFTPAPQTLGWSLTLNSTPTTGRLTLSF